MLNRMQLKAARAWLDLSQDELAAASGVAKRTIARIELGSAVSYDRTIRDLQTTLEQRGIEFVFENGRGIGILVKDSVSTREGG